MLARTRLLATCSLVAAATLTLAGCTPPSGEDAATTAATGAASDATGEPTASAEETAPATDAAAAPGDCLVGDWVLTDDQMQAFYDQVNVDLAEYAIVYDPTGSSGLSFTADGRYTYTPDLTLAVDIAGLAAEATLDGTLSGEYTADASTITTANDTNGLNMDVTVDGVAMDGTAVTEQILASPIQSAAYDCSGDTPVISFSTGASSVPVTLARG